MKKAITLLLGLICALGAMAQTDSLKHAFNVTSMMWSRGEYRKGALPADNGEDYALFLMSNAVLRFDYVQPWLEVRFAPKFFGIWGSATSGGIAIDETWIGLKHKSGLFMRLGRQKIEYDDERIFGSDDWSMASLTHDVLKAGLERGRHKLHFLVAFNQNDENTNGGTYYKDGGQPYKSMQTVWYHVDPIPQLGASLIFMNTGMQRLSNEPTVNETKYQQLYGTHIEFHPSNFRLQASYYGQSGRDEHALPIHAWMTAAEADWQVHPRLTLNTGFFYMSGDPYYFVPPEGLIGVAHKTEVRGFNPIFGSHHKFYGAMDFFYVKTYYGGNTPGLQDYHARVLWKPVEPLLLDASYHFLATSVPINSAKSQALGHEFEFSAAWDIMDNVSLQAGYSYMKGTETMKILKRSSDKNSLHWGWIMLVVTPKFFSYNW